MNYLGCHLDPAQTDAVCLALANAGKEPLFCDGASELKGYGIGKDVFLWEAEEKLFGKTLPAFHQRIGSCVGQGTTRACQDSLYWSLAFGGRIGNPVALSVEVTYGGSRVQIGKGGLRGDGSYGGWASLFVHNFGLVERKKYGKYDLSQANEDWSEIFGDSGVPKEVLREALKAEACYRCLTIEDIRDAVASGRAVSFCCNMLWQVPDGQSTSRNKDGMCRPVQSGGHCEYVRGVTSDGRFVRQNSWGNYPRGPNMRLSDGREVVLPQGAYGAYPEDMEAALKQRGAEAWAFAPPVNNWRQAA